MTDFLLDPWVLEAVERGEAVGLRSLGEFLRLVRRTGFRVVPFMDDTEVARFFAPADRRRRTAAWARVAGFIEHFRREASGAPEAKVVGGPAVPMLWNQALRELLGNGTEFRTPRILCATATRGRWPAGPECEVRAPDLPAPQPRVLATVEQYEAHPFSVTDFDPWDLRHAHPIVAGAQPHLQHPCVLPKPPELDGVLPSELDGPLEATRRAGWKRPGGGIEFRYFIPAPRWRAEAVTRERWRAGRAFDMATIDRHHGYIDYEERLWEWHVEERHWDIQTAPQHTRVSHTGAPLRQH